MSPKNIKSKTDENQSSKISRKDKKIDIVCGMDLEEYSDLAQISHKGGISYFCGKECEKKFKENPDKFNGTPLIKLTNVWKVFNLGGTETKVLRGLSINIWEGDFVVIVGPSGSGKSTALNMIGLLDRPTSGKIFLNGKNISLAKDDERAEFRSKTFGFVFQQYNLIPWLTAYENATLPLIFSGKKIEEKKISASFEKIGLSDRKLHRPFELSGGEQQRVALLRALVNSPEIILGDEPTGNLDSVTGDKILKILIDLNKINKKTLIVVTHDVSIAKKADQVIAFKDGRLVRDHRTHRNIYMK